MVKKLSSIILAFSLALNVAFVSVWAYHRFYVYPKIQRKPRMGWRGRWDRDHDDDDRGPRMLRDLSESQKERLGEARRELAQQVGRAHVKVGKTREKLFALLDEPEPDRKEIQQCVEDLNEARAEIPRATVDHILKLRQILTPEQQEQLLDMMREQTSGHGRALQDMLGDRKGGPRPRPGRGGGRQRRRMGAPPDRDSGGPRRSGR